MIAGGGDFRPTVDSPAIDAGTDVGPGADILGVVAQGAPDVGAYETGALTDLGVTMSDNPDPVHQGSTLTYTITVTNSGSTNATGVMLDDTLPGSVSVSGYTASQGTCGGSPVFTCNLGTLAAGVSAQITLNVVPNTVGNITNTATVAAGATTIDRNTSNNTATATTTVIAPDLLPTAFSASKSKGKVIVSDTVKNQGNGNAGTFTVAYYLSTNTTYEPGTDIPLASSSGGSGACTRPVTSLGAGLSSSISNKTCYKPTGAVTGTRYYVLVVDDSANQLVESNETNNVRAASGQVWW